MHDVILLKICRSWIRVTLPVRSQYSVVLTVSHIYMTLLTYMPTEICALQGFLYIKQMTCIKYYIRGNEFNKKYFHQNKMIDPTWNNCHAGKETHFNISIISFYRQQRKLFTETKITRAQASTCIIHLFYRHKISKKKNILKQI